jgi:CoA-transferase family III
MEAQDERSSHNHSTPSQGALTGLRVIELADEQAEYCGLVLAGLGAEVIKVEPPGGSPTCHIGPFYEDRQGPERSLFFWQYNRGKRSIVLDLHQQQDRDRFCALVATADVLLESTPRGELDGLGLGADSAAAVSHPDCGVHVPLRGPWSVGQLQGLRPGAGGRHDELRLRSDPGRQVRSAADRPADVARLPHRR